MGRGGTRSDVGTKRHSPLGGWILQYRDRPSSVVKLSSTGTKGTPRSSSPSAKARNPVPFPRKIPLISTCAAGSPSCRRCATPLKSPRQRQRTASFSIEIGAMAENTSETLFPSASPNFSRPGSSPQNSDSLTPRSA